MKAFDNDHDLVLFYIAWLKNGLNATNAYLELHPDVSNPSARVLGSKLLTKINKEILLNAYGLDIQKYFKQLAEGLEAMKVNEFTGELYADHSVRRFYHDKLGKMLGLEKDKALLEFNQTVNNFIGWDKFMQMMKERSNVKEAEVIE